MRLSIVIPLLALLAAGCRSAAPLAASDPMGKNVYDVLWGTPPADFATMIGNAPEEWNFNFRPYGASSDWLWSDSNVRRDAATDGVLADGRVTGLRVSCDAEGIHALVYGAEPGLAGYLAKTNACPSPALEYFLAPGDADERGVQHRYMCYYGDGVNREFENREPDRQFRYAAPEVSEVALKNSIVVKITWRWTSFWDRLPLFNDRRDNFWRLSMIRWVGGGVTWGGTVHQNSQAGYIRWPDFTPAQRTAIVRTTLERGWKEFCAATADNRLSIGKVSAGWFGPTEARRRLEPRSFVNLNEDPEFRPILERMIGERRALAPEIARVGEMGREEQDAFYRRASELLFNFPWAVQEAYGEQVSNRLFDEDEGKENAR